MAEFSYDVEDKGGTVVVSLAGELDMSATFRLEPEFERLAGEEATHTLVLDMADVTFLDSSALGLMLTTEQRLQAEDVRFVVADPSRAVRRIFEVTGVADTIVITGSSAG